MAANRKRGADALRWGTLFRALLACAVIAALGVGYVRQTKSHYDLGHRGTELELQRERAADILSHQREILSRLTSPTELRQRVRQFGLGLTNALPSQRVFVAVPPPTPLVPAANPAGGRLPARPVATLAVAPR